SRRRLMMRHVDERIVVESSVRQLPHRAAVKQGIAVVGVVGLAAGALLLSASAAPAAPTAFNPFAVNNGFTIVAQGDATLGNAELEGSIAAFGSIASGRPDGFPVIHHAAGNADYSVPTIDESPVRILAGEFVGDGAFDVANRDDSETIDPASPEANATVRLTSVDGLTLESRSGGAGSNDTGTFARANSSAGGYLDLKAVPFEGADVDDLLTEQPTVPSYFPDLDAQVAQANQCLADMYDPETGLANPVTVSAEGGLVYVEDFATDQPNVIDYDAIAGQTIKLDRADGYRPTAEAPLVIRVPAGTTELNQVNFEGWSAQAGADQDLARYIMFDLSEVTGEVTVDGLELGALWAPEADLTFGSGITTNGQWFAQDVTTSGGGEIHHHTFGGQLVCDTEDPTEEPTTEEPAEDPTEEPAEDPTTEEPAEDPTTVGPDTDDPGTDDPSGADPAGPADDGGLAVTGADAGGVLAVAAGLLLAGAMTVLLVRRRTHG
uniref:collagen-binding domain-containing protein n=1 Tax=Ruania albidiflava TaxID=366586 RepID=UPI0023F44CEC